MLLYFIGYSWFRVTSDHSPIPNSLLLHQLRFLFFQVNLIDKLHNMGVVKPARVDETGQPVEVEHVLQLVEDQGVLLG